MTKLIVKQQEIKGKVSSNKLYFHLKLITLCATTPIFLFNLFVFRLLKGLNFYKFGVNGL